MGRGLGLVMALTELSHYVSNHGLWKQGATKMLDMQIVNLGMGSYLLITP